MIDLGENDKGETPKKSTEPEEKKNDGTPESKTANSNIGGNSSGDSTGSSDLKNPSNIFAVGES
jgi:hypothetical protein